VDGAKSLRRYQVTLDSRTADYLREVGAGSLSPGIRAAVRRLDQTWDDALIMALRLYSEPESTMAPETVAVMARWRLICDHLLGVVPTILQGD
jgi:hypothetical protein